MPELPEVEITRRGIAPALVGKVASGAVLRVPALRYPLPQRLATKLRGRTLRGVRRRGKYLLLDFGSGHLLIHLGMSGSLRLVAATAAPQKHDHVDLVFGSLALRLRDPRRFGAMLWLTGDPAEHSLLASLGLEPLEDAFTPQRLREMLAGRSTAIKQALMDSRIVVGVGNIYASESLFLAGIDPRTPAGRVSLMRLRRLVPALRATLAAAIEAGGSTLRDFVQADGSSGYFQQLYDVYGRAGEPCHACAGRIRGIRQGGRATYFCPRCQR